MFRLKIGSVFRVSRPISTRTRFRHRTFATELPRPPPPTHEPQVETFSASAKPRPYYARPPPRRDLPLIKVTYFYICHGTVSNHILTLPAAQKRWPMVLALSGLGLGCWAVFLLFMTNQEKISSSVVRQVMRAVRSDAQLQELLGEAIRPQPEWWLNGDPIIHGSVSLLYLNT